MQAILDEGAPVDALTLELVAVAREPKLDGSTFVIGTACGRQEEIDMNDEDKRKARVADEDGEPQARRIRILARLGDDMKLAELVAAAHESFERRKVSKAGYDARWARHHELFKVEARVAEEAIASHSTADIERWFEVRKQIAAVAVNEEIAADDYKTRHAIEQSDSLAVRAVYEYIEQAYLDGAERIATGCRG